MIAHTFAAILTVGLLCWAQNPFMSTGSYPAHPVICIITVAILMLGIAGWMEEG